MSNYHFFWGGPLSNFHPINGDKSFTSEKIYMAQKAICFRDTNTLTLISKSQTPREAKILGRQVANFDQDIWDQVKVSAMMFALHTKWTVCPIFRKALQTSATLTLVEASPTDRIWGIGFKADDAEANVEKWGQNLLGHCLMNLRREVAS